MRIIAGEFRSRKLFTPPDAEVTRPIPDRVKESVFMILRGHCEDAAVFDCFSGTGAIGLEALSRGAKRVVMVEKDRAVAAVLQKNIEALGVADRCELVVGDALGAGAISRCPRPVHLIFFDPPYPVVRDHLGWKRVSGQFARAIQLLDATGYAVLRTPWPLQHMFNADGSPHDPHGAGSVPPGGGGVGVPGAGSGGAGEAARDAKHARKVKGSRGKGSGGRGAHRDFDPTGEIGIDLTGNGEKWDEMWSAQRGTRGAGGEPEFDPFGEDDVPPAALRSLPDGEEAEPTVAAKPVLKDVDLTLPGAIGPETHEYAGMAVHLYMKAPPTA